MRKLILIGLLWLVPSAIATATAAQVALPNRSLAGPLGKVTSGHLICGATNRVLAAAADVHLTIRNAAGVPVATQLFPNLAPGATVEIQLGPGPGGAYTCLSESDGRYINLTLTHKNALQRATASMSGADADYEGPMTRNTDRSQAGPIGPGIGYRIVCRGTTSSPQVLTVSVTDENGNIPPGGQKTAAVNARGILEVGVNAVYGQEYFCNAAGSQEVVNASIEARNALGEPTAAVADSSFQVED